MIVDKIQENCLICGSMGVNLYTGVHDKIFGVIGSFNYKKCNNKNCEFIWQDPMVRKKDIGEMYKDYYTHGFVVKNGGSEWFKRAMRLPGHWIDAILMRCTGIRKNRKELRYFGMKGLSPGRMLEVGCGRGEKLVIFKQLGWDVVGQDIDPNAVECAVRNCGVDVLCGDLLAMNLEGGQFDVIVANHVVEHVYDIAEMFEEFYRLLKNGGRLIVVTPNTKSLGHKIFRDNWRGLEPPRHLHLFSMNNMRNLLNKTGFLNIDIQTNAASARGVFEDSYQIKDNARLFSNHRPPTLVYYKSIYLQYKEWFLCKIGRTCGEELRVMAIK